MPRGVVRTRQFLELLCSPEGISVIQMNPDWESWPRGVDPKVIDGSLPQLSGKGKRAGAVENSRKAKKKPSSGWCSSKRKEYVA